MQGKRLSIGLTAAIATFTLALFATITCAAQQETVLHSFGNGTDATQPLAGLIFDSAGNLYGAASGGGINGQGAVFELSPQQGGGYTETVLHSFGSGTDGQIPYAPSLIFDSAGNLYGTTEYGGTYNDGTVFELSPNGHGGWTETVLYSFGNGTVDGQNPFTGLIFDAVGNLYGTTYDGGIYGYGTAFELSPAGGGTWTETVLYNFGNGTGVGRDPRAGLVFDAAGNLYGVCKFGGGYGYGTAFELSPNGQGGWTDTTLHLFNDNGSDGYQPLGNLILDAAGNLYGTTYGGGIYCSGSGGCGTVFELSPQEGGGYTETVLHSFGNGTDGQFPLDTLIFDAGGDLYGTTSAGGVNNFGTVFKMRPQAGGGYVETVLYSFASGTDGTDPWANLIFDNAGNLYGTTRTGGGYCSGQNGCGTVFVLTPGPKTGTTTTLVSSANPSTVGEPVTFTATVSPAGPPIPTGTVSFTANGTTIAGCSAVPLSSSHTAACMTTALPAGSNAMVATYSGDINYSGSSGTLSQVVNQGASSTTVTSGQNPSTSGQPVTLTATVAPAGPPIPTGTVGFTSNGTTITGCSAVALSSSRTATCTTSTLAVGTDTIVATYSGDGNYLGSGGMLSQIVNPVPAAVQFVPLTPCRVVDTRNGDGTFGGPAITGNSSRNFPLSLSGNPCGIPSTAVAYSLNVTVVPETTLGYLTIWPSGEGQPIVSTLNSPDGRVKANAAIVPAGMPSGSVSVYVTNTTNVILDIDGYFASPTQGSLQFYTLTPCRIVDTRNGDGGELQAGAERDYTIAGQCGIPSDAAAYSFNVTVLPAAGGLDYLTVWPKGESRPTVSTLNDNTGTVVANAAIVPAGSENATAFYAHSNNTNLLLDVDGYFAAPRAGGLSMYPLTPCRVLDTRQNSGSFVGEKTVNVVGSACAPPSNATAYIFNATVVPPGPMLYLTLWPDGEQQPVVSTLNAEDGFITSNMAIVPTTNGSIDAYAYALTQLILDISGYFAP